MLELVKIAALALLVGLIAAEWCSALTSAAIGAGVFYLLCVRVTPRPPGVG